ncbi:MAG: hypothetical protein AAGC49_02390 [Brevundimonas sp.]
MNLRGSREDREAELVTGKAIPLAALRVLLVPIVAAMVLVASSAQWPGHGAVWAWAPLIGAAVMVRPWGVVPALAGLLTGAIVLVGGPVPGGVVAVLVLLVHLTLAVSAFVARGSWRASIEVQVLKHAARPFVVVQAGAQVLAVVALLVSGVSLGTADLWRAVALIAVLVVAFVALPSSPDAD